MVNGKALDITNPAESVLDLCLRNGVAVPWECNKGTCGTCRVNVTMDGTASSILTCLEKPAEGMHIFLSTQVCAGLDDARKVADNIIRYLEYRMQGTKLADDEARLDPLVAEHAPKLEDKLSGKKLKQLLRGEHIHLDKSGLNDLEAMVLARVGSHRNPALRLLDLNGNPGIGDAGATFLAEELVGTDHELRSLFLSSCGITDVGACALAKALKQNDDLMILELRKNGLTDDAASELAEAMANHPSLQHVYLTGNQIGDQGALKLAAAVVHLANHGRKVRLWLTDNPGISEDARAYILEETPKHTVKI